MSDIVSKKEKQRQILKSVDKQVLKAADKLIAYFRATGMNLDLATYTALGKTIYNSNRYILENMRDEDKSIPHIALINFARYFKIDFDYFYTEDAEFEIPDILKGKPVVSEEDIQRQAINETEDRLTLFESEYELINHKDNEVKEVQIELKSIIENLKALYTESDFELRRNYYIKTFDYTLSSIRTKLSTLFKKMEQAEQLVVTQAELKKLTIQNKALLDDIKKTEKEVDEFKIIALKAQKGETEALKRLLDFKS